MAEPDHENAVSSSRRTSFMASLKNGFMDKLSNKLKDFRSKSQNKPQSPSRMGLHTQVLNQGISKVPVRLSIDPVRREHVLDAEIETLKKEETDLSERLDEVNGLLTSMERIDSQTRRREEEELEQKTLDFQSFATDLEQTIADISSRRDKLKEQHRMAENLVALLKRQLEEVKNRRDELKESLSTHDKDIVSWNKKLTKGSEQYRKELAEMEESIKLRRRDDESLINNYRDNEKKLQNALEERMVIRRSLEERRVLVAETEMFGFSEDDQAIVVESTEAGKMKLQEASNAIHEALEFACQVVENREEEEPENQEVEELTRFQGEEENEYGEYRDYEELEDDAEVEYARVELGQECEAELKKVDADEEEEKVAQFAEETALTDSATGDLDESSEEEEDDEDDSEYPDEDSKYNEIALDYDDELERSENETSEVTTD